MASVYIGDKMEVVPPKIIEKGKIPTVQSSPSMYKNVMMGILLGNCSLLRNYMCDYNYG